LEALVEEAHAAGAWGAKLSGAGQGGNMIALVDEITIDDVAAALRQAGAQRVTRSTVR
jgi:mevalonate kinase